MVQLKAKGDDADTTTTGEAATTGEECAAVGGVDGGAAGGQASVGSVRVIAGELELTLTLTLTLTPTPTLTLTLTLTRRAARRARPGEDLLARPPLGRRPHGAGQP